MDLQQINALKGQRRQSDRQESNLHDHRSRKDTESARHTIRKDNMDFPSKAKINLLMQVQNNSAKDEDSICKKQKLN
jgi:hypothetical protein